jgi:hypothetical protein
MKSPSEGDECLQETENPGTRKKLQYPKKAQLPNDVFVTFPASSSAMMDLRFGKSPLRPSQFVA